MSIALMSQVWPLDIPSTEKLVLLALADNANDDGECWPSIGTIADKTALSERTVHYAIKRLAQSGHLLIKNRFGCSNLFTLIPARGAPLHEIHPAPDAPQEVQGVHPTPAPDAPTPARGAPRIIKEPSRESSIEPKRRAHATRIPGDFELTEARAEYARARGIDPVVTMEEFRDYWTAESGARATKHDWDAAWRIWCRRQRSFASNTAKSQAPARGDTAAWAELEAHAKAVGFRTRNATDTLGSFRTDLMLFQRPQRTLGNSISDLTQRLRMPQ